MQWITDPQYTEEEFFDWTNLFLGHITSTRTAPHVWVDVGAFCGDITQHMVAHSNEHDIIYAFEPEQEQYKFLCDKFQFNQNVVVWPLAVSNTVENSDFYVPFPGIRPGSSFLKGTINDIHASQCVKTRVTVTSLDTIKWPKDKQISFIKIDAETNDFLVMQGAQQIMQSHRPIIMFEFSGAIGGEVHNYSAAEWYSFFRENNYHLRSPFMGHSNRYIISRYNKYSPELYNLLAVPDENPLLF